MNLKIFNLVCVIFITSLFLSGCQINERLKPENSPLIVKPINQPETQVVLPNVITIEKLELHATEDNQTAFELLKANAELETKEYDFGVFIESINGLKSDQQHFWALYVNDQKSETGADQTKLRKGDVTKWVWEEIKL